MLVLGIESSCDDTCAAVLDKENHILSQVTQNQLIHSQFGGVVPELASRCHLQTLLPVIDEALNQAHVDKKDLQGIAVTSGPGLLGAVLVGLSIAKGMAYILRIPFVGIHHLEGHIFSAFLEENIFFSPHLCLVVSGGHTQLILVPQKGSYQILGTTLDDAAGEAFDKVAKMLGFGYPGGKEIDQQAKKGNPLAYHFPRACPGKENYQFSFSGLKTAVLTQLKKNPINNLADSERKQKIADLCASFQAAVVEVLINKTISAANQWKLQSITVVGGVAANTALRAAFEKKCSEQNMRVFFPKPSLCTDNAAMIAAAGIFRLAQQENSPYNLNAFANLSLADWNRKNKSSRINLNPILNNLHE